jgi:hypothetical protein
MAWRLWDGRPIIPKRSRFLRYAVYFCIALFTASLTFAADPPSEPTEKKPSASTQKKRIVKTPASSKSRKKRTVKNRSVKKPSPTHREKPHVEVPSASEDRQEPARIVPSLPTPQKKTNGHSQNGRPVNGRSHQASPVIRSQESEDILSRIRSAQSAMSAQSTTDLDDSPPLNLVVTPWLAFGAKLSTSLERIEDLDLRHRKQDDVTSLKPHLDIAASVGPYRDVSLFWETRLLSRHVFPEGPDKTVNEHETKIRKAYLLFKNAPFPSSDLQVGRQRFKDSREWLYDKNLDAVALFVNGVFMDMELSVSTNLIDPSGPEDDIVNYILYATDHSSLKDKVAFYGMVRHDGKRSELDPLFLGASWRGRSIKRQKFWLDTASVFGHDGPKRLMGYGVDMGWTSRVNLFKQTSLTFGYALGSGDKNRRDDLDRNFRQTGLQGNSGKFNGKTKFQYYGQVFNPELSNMIIWTGAWGILPKPETSMDIVYHYYTQVYRANKFRDVQINEKPSGKERELGHEVDLIIGAQVAQNVEAALTTGLFIPGRAFVKKSNAFLAELVVQVQF